MSTLTLTTSDQYALLQFAAQRCHVEKWPGDAYAWGAVDAATGELQAVWVVCDRRAESVEMHFASNLKKKFATPTILKTVFTHVFRGLGVRRIEAPIPENKITALTAALRTGFRFQGRISGYMGDTDAILLGMLAHQCPWLDPEPNPET